MGSWPDLLGLAGQIVVAAVLGAVVGMERERGDHPAGLRTHILVCVGAALITLVSREMAGTRFDPGRIAAQIVSGIGFLGAGTILRQGTLVRGLTTAASLWVVAGIGMAVAAGGAMAWLAAFASLLVLFTLTVLNRFDFDRTSEEGRLTLFLTIAGDREQLGRLLADMAGQQVTIKQVKVHSTEEIGQLKVELELATRSVNTARLLTSWLSRQSAVIGWEWE